MLQKINLLILTFAVICFCASAQLAPTKLPEYEIKALQNVSKNLGLRWDFSVDPCSGDKGWIVPLTKPLARNVTCTCNSTLCHVTSIQLKALNLSGPLPDEFSKLTSLAVIDLTRNYFHGAFPISWTTLPLTNLSLIGNRISGKLPVEIGEIASLKTLILADNAMEGPLPHSLGNLINLNRLVLGSNNFSGELPDTLGKLKVLTDFEIDGNPFSGRIPSFIGNWKMIQRIDMQGTSMEGPFPPEFSKLWTLSELRVSDISSGRSFPFLKNMTNMERLILRNLSLSGKIPDYIGDMTNLRTLDLSFNNLSGEIPGNLENLQRITYLYLTNNFLTGSIPNWILRSSQNIDISSNDFSGPSWPTNCQQAKVNLAASYSPTHGNLISTCFIRNLPCSGEAMNYNLFINCGGTRVTTQANEYEEDTSQHGPSTYGASASGKWAYMSTGDFTGNQNQQFIETNSSIVKMNNTELYTTARASPLSLKYYGLCLQKGNYTVNLHFSEIVFTDIQAYTSNGIRVFDVYIQGRNVLHDFNIAKESNGTGKELVKTFTAIVNENTLEIHFQWAGKGSHLIPSMGIYGPLVSAISVTPNFKPYTGKSKLSVGSIVAIVISCVVFVALFVCLGIWWRSRKQIDKELRGLELLTGYINLRQLKTATNNFDPANKIGEGGFGPVYKGILPDSSVIAVKQLSSESKQGNREFLNEIGIISTLQHPNLVKLYGCCIEESQLLVIYEYMENNSLARALFGPERTRLKLDWTTRCKICLGIARGLTYLHEESTLKIVHRDIKATNVLLEKDLTAKISDFGLARLDDEEGTHISTRIAGTRGYMAPEYAIRGHLTDKADVYSFGVVTLEIVSGKSNTNFRPAEELTFLLDWAYVLQEQGRLLELVDTTLGTGYSKKEAAQMLDLALVCTNPSPTLRPSMSSVVSMLEGKTPVQVPMMKKTITEGETLRFKAFEEMRDDNTLHSAGEMRSMNSPATPSYSDTSSFLS